jgi:hypothetical protein
MFPVGIGIITGVMKNVNLQFGSRCATGELATPLVSATMPAIAYFILAMYGGNEGLEDGSFGGMICPFNAFTSTAPLLHTLRLHRDAAYI